MIGQPLHCAEAFKKGFSEGLDKGREEAKQNTILNLLAIKAKLSYANKQIDDAEAEARSLAEFKKEHGYEKTEWAPGTDFF